MGRALLVLVVAGLGLGARTLRTPMAWPLRATVTDLHGRPVGFSVVSDSGSVVMMETGRAAAIPQVRQLTPREVLHATTLATFPMDLNAGYVTFRATGADTLRVTIENLWNQLERVQGEGVVLTARLARGKVVINPR